MSFKRYKPFFDHCTAQKCMINYRSCELFKVKKKKHNLQDNITGIAILKHIPKRVILQLCQVITFGTCQFLSVF
jgi:hypothetical protein